MAEMSNFTSIINLTFKWTMLIKRVQKLIFSNLLKIKKWNLAAISTASKDFLSTQFSLNLWKNSLYIITKTYLGNQELKMRVIFVCNHIYASYLHKYKFLFEVRALYIKCTEITLLKLVHFLDVLITFKHKQNTFRYITGNPHRKSLQTITKEWEGVHFTITQLLFLKISSNKRAKWTFPISWMSLSFING